MTPLSVPLAISRAAPRAIKIQWAEGHEGIYPTRDLRLACPCAQCQEELSGRPLLDPRTVPDTVDAVGLSLVGGYGVRFEWSDGHATGIYTYELLLRLCPCAACAAARGGTVSRQG